MEHYQILEDGEHELIDTDYDVVSEILEVRAPSATHFIEKEENYVVEKGETITESPTDVYYQNKRKYSFVWQYYRAVEGSTHQFQCLLCKSCVGNQTSNLARHLATSHNITKEKDEKTIGNLVQRPSRSFIWKYCTKEDPNHARCHLCNKVLYFGGGNTANITKHLKRLHSNVIKEITNTDSKMDNETMQATSSLNQSFADTPNANNSALMNSADRRERRGASYVWNYCEKLSRHTIRCRLCTKVMSFHGTANVITHLQRKHNVLGEPGCNPIAVAKQEINDSSYDMDNSDQIDSEYANKKRKSLNSASIVWKYCTRISRDQVRCSFCKKNLSYQGTSNLQRHLHRMHGVITHGRYKAGQMDSECATQVRADQVRIPKNCDFIWQFCSKVDDNQRTKCNMCEEQFDIENIHGVVKHLVAVHSLETNQTSSGDPNQLKNRNKRLKNMDSDSDDDDEDDDGYETKWRKLDEECENQNMQQEFHEDNIKKDDSFYDDIIEEDHNNLDEEAFDPSTMQDVPHAIPLSPQSSNEDTGGTLPQSYEQNNSAQFMSSTNVPLPPLPALDTRLLQKLQEERLRSETEYFKEKAAYYRMQKFLTALQARKVKFELERLHQLDGATVVTSEELNGAYAVEVSEHQLVTHQ